VSALTCPVCKSITTSNETCTSCGLDLISCLACGGLNPATSQVCLICGEKLASKLPLHAGTTVNSPRKVDEPQAAAEVQVSNPRPSSEANEVQSDRPSASVASGIGPAFTPRKGTVAGVARGCQVRQETRNATTTWQILAFRLDRFDDAGQPLPSVPVEMRGLHLKGHINDGEWIEVPGNWKSGKLLEPRRVRNLTTGSWVEVGGSGLWLLQLLFVLVFVAVVLFLFWMFYESAQKQFDDFGKQHSINSAWSQLGTKVVLRLGSLR
jgi:hypothetical protein